MNIALENADISRDRTPVLAGISLSVAPGERVCIAGPSGSGKSTLLMALAGLVPITAGQGPDTHGVSYVLQRPEECLLADRVDSEVALTMEMLRPGGHIPDSQVDRFLAPLGFTREDWHRDPMTLSGGQQRRLAIAAVMASEPHTMCLDEPSAGLDAATRWELTTVIAGNAAQGQTILVATHDMRFAVATCDRAIILGNHSIRFDGSMADLFAHRDFSTFGLAMPTEFATYHALARARGRQVEAVTSSEALARCAELAGGAR